MRGGFCKKAAANDMTSAAARSGQRGSNSLTAIPRMARRHSRDPWLTSDQIAPPARGGGSEFGGASPVIPKRKDTTCRRVLLFGAGNEARTRLPPSREWLAAIRGTPGSPRIRSRLRRGVEAASSAGLLLSFQKERTRLVVVSFFLERATRLELATSTLARWRSTR